MPLSPGLPQLIQSVLRCRGVAGHLAPGSSGGALSTVLVLVAILASTLLVAGCSGGSPPSAAPGPGQPSPTPAAQARMDTLEEYVDAEIGTLDPAQSNDLYSNRAVSQVCETLLEYHYLKRPYTLQPCLAAEMPRVSEDGLTVTIPLLPGVRFQDDPCFPDGKGRELVAGDFAVAWKRLADSQTRSPGWWIFDGKIAGLDEYREQTTEQSFRDEWSRKTGEKGGHWRAPVAGIRTPDDHTLVVTLTAPSPQFIYFLAMTYTAPIPMEALELYGKEIAAHPVGTGPYTVDYFDGNSKVVYLANPNYREVFYPAEGEEGDEEKGLLAAAGRRVPLVERVELHVIVEDLPRWLQFAGGQTDRYAPTHDVFSQIVNPSRDGLTSKFRSLGMRLDIYPNLDVTYTCFNMEDPLVGENVYLRRAMSLAFDAVENIRELRNGRGIPAMSPIPPGIFGHDPARTSPYRMPDDMDAALEQARKMMKRAGYPDGAGLPKLAYASISGAVSRDFDQQFFNAMSKIGIEFDVKIMSWPEFDEMIRGKRGQVWGVAWGADYPDAENFLQLLYGPNASPGPNGSNYSSARFDELYPQMVAAPNGPERARMIDEMVSIIQNDCPWIFGVHRTTFVISQGWLQNYKYCDIGGNYFRYYGIDAAKKRELLGQFKKQ